MYLLVDDMLVWWWVEHSSSIAFGTVLALQSLHEGLAPHSSLQQCMCNECSMCTRVKGLLTVRYCMHCGLSMFRVFEHSSELM